MDASLMLRHRPWEEASDFTIGLKPIPLENWLEGDDPETARKAALLAATPDLVWAETPGSRDGQAEVLAMVEAATGLKGLTDAPPLWTASLLCADDLCLMERRDGAWTLTAVSLCSGTFFTAKEAVGHDLAALHGPVPDFAETFLSRVQRMFDAFGPDIVVERRNWTVAASGEAHLPSSTPVRERIAEIAPDAAANELFIRIERQTLRRLPRTGGVIFTIRTWRDPLSTLLVDRSRLAAFAKAWREATPRFAAYKGFALYRHLVDDFLAREGV